MPASSATPVTSAESQSPFSFLASHGLRSPLSAIRWACGRLRKTSTGDLNKEQRELVEEIHANAKTLTTVLGSMQLLGKLEDRTYKIKHEEVALANLLLSLTHGLEHARAVEWKVSCPADMHVNVDGPVLESILVNLLTVCMESCAEPRAVSIDVTQDNGDTLIHLFAALELPFLYASAAEDKREVSRLVGGIPGLMLCLSSAMAQFLHGGVALHEATLVERKHHAAAAGKAEDVKLYRISLGLKKR